METAPQEMANILRTPLLATKLHLPRPTARLLHRSLLDERLEQGMSSALTLISAPAGFGKTTLLADYLTRSATPAAWLSLEADDNELVRFLSYVITALQTLDQEVGKTSLALLQSSPPGTVEPIIGLLANDLVGVNLPSFALVLDDYHVIEDPAIHRALTFLLGHLPAQMHLVIATRADPPLPLARLRARGQLCEVRAADLRFATAEVDTFLRTVMQLDLTPGEIPVLQERTEGWIAGIQLAALSLRGRSDVSAFLSAFSGSHRFVLDYLSDEVFSQQSAGVQSFLLHTCILDRMNGSLVNAVTELTNGQEMLERLEHANLFVVPLDDERGWYRYHHLFAEVLRGRLQQTQPSLLPALHRRASTWYLDFGAVSEAIHHLLLAGDTERVADVIEAQGLAFSTGNSERISSLLGWLNLLPDELVRARPTLCLLHATTFIRTNQFDRAEARLQDAENSLDERTPVEQVRLIKGAAATLRANLCGIQGDLVDTFVFAQQAVDLLPESATYMQAIARMVLAHAAHGDGDVTAQREQNAVEAEALIRQTGNVGGTLNTIAALARLRFLQGRLHQAVATYLEARQLLEEREDLQALADSVGYYFGMGDIHREWNHLDEAEPLLLRCLEPIRGIFAVAHEVVTQGYGSLTRLYMARGDYDKAIKVLDSFAQLTREQRFTSLQIAQGAAVRAQVELARGKLAPALHWAETSGLSVHDGLSYPRELSYLVLARVLIAQGRADPAGSYVKEALSLLERLLADATAKARMSTVLEVLVLQSLAFAAQADRKRALAVLERALTLASPEGYVRIFLDEGEPMLALLRLVQEHGIVPGYTATLLAASSQTARASAPNVSASSALLKPLTEREVEVLHLIATGASNEEIAEQLVIAISTVKRHVSNIFGKLAVSNRTQAVTCAQSIGLL
jgi:LuxR family transcriptional regulator, maltose regulon positive regulatory protein